MAIFCAKKKKKISNRYENKISRKLYNVFTFSKQIGQLKNKNIVYTITIKSIEIKIKLNFIKKKNKNNKKNQ